MLLKKDETYGKIKGAGPEEKGFAIGDTWHEEGSRNHEENESEDDGGNNWNFYFVMKQPDDVGKQHAHESRNGVCRSNGETDGDVGKSIGDGDGGSNGLQLRVFQVGAESA